LDRSDLELVLAVRLHGSLVKAARALQLAPPVVTKRLSALESHLGVRLFQRTTRRVSPTTEGHALCDRAAELLGGFVALEDELRERQSEPSGTIRIACSFGFGRLWLGPLLAEFHARYPAVRLDLQLCEQLPDLANESFDAAIWLWHPPVHIAADWVSRKLAANQRVLVASPAYLAQHGTPKTLEDLASHACLVVRENGGDTGQGQRFGHWRLSTQRTARTPSRAQHVNVKGPLSSNSGEMVRDWCLSGQGIMLRSLWDIAPQLASGELIRVLDQYAMYDADIHWLAPYRSQLPKRIRLLQDFLASRFREEPWKHSAR
jgi:DNA-binding transcriptional LysR family regulator